MSDHSSDSHLDRELKNVPLPDGLLDRLRGVADEDMDDAAWSDTQIDHSLSQVPLPGGMMDRLRAAVAEEMVDESLRTVDVPAGMLTRLHGISNRRPNRWTQVAAAASLFFIVSSVYLSWLLAIGSSIRPQVIEPIVDVTLPYDGPLEIESYFSEEVVEVEIVDQIVPALDDSDESEFRPTLVDFSEPMNGPVRKLMTDMKQSGRFEDDFLLIKFRLLGAPLIADDELPYLERTPEMPRGGIRAPVLPQYNRRFLSLHDVHPPVNPAAHDALRSVEVGLSTSTASFDATMRAVESGRLPDNRDIRVEDFLAAVGNYVLPAAKDRVALRVSAGPSRFGRQLSPQLASELGWPRAMAQRPAGLIHLGLAAGRKTRPRVNPVHLTVALDVSSSMRWDDRLVMARRAIEKMAEHLGPNDRISLLAFNERLVETVDSVGREDVSDLLRVLNRLKASGGTNLSNGLPAAITMALGQPWDHQPLAHKLVLITDGQSDLGNNSTMLAEKLIEQASSYGLEFTAIELDDDGERDQVLLDLAEAAGGEFYSVMDPDRLRWMLVEALTDTSSLVATDIKMKVTLRPQVVMAYRLMGHEARSLVGSTVAIDSELHQGESAGTLMEVWLQPGTADLVGFVDVEWRDPATGNVRKLRQRISRSEFAGSFHDASLPLQAATIAAESAEILRQSPFAQTARSRSLKPVLDLAETLNTTLTAQPSFRSFLRALKKIDSAKLQVGGD